MSAAALQALQALVLFGLTVISAGWFPYALAFGASGYALGKAHDWTPGAMGRVVLVGAGAFVLASALAALAGRG